VLPTLLVGISPMLYESQNVRFPLWQFLNQPVFDPTYKTVFSPRKFIRVHTVELLERCLKMDVGSPDRRID
jgi:hypothetical protein